MKKALSLFFTLFLIVIHANAQVVTISGTIKDDLNETLPGAAVAVKGSHIGTSSDIDGNYTLDVPTGTKSVVFSFLGLVSQELAVPKNGGVINVTLKPDETILDEVVVTGYGTYKKSAYAGSASTVKMQGMEDVPAISLSTMLQGSASGVQVNSASGQPGGAVSVMVRGMGSFNASTSPLYVIDGVPVMSGNINSASTTVKGEVSNDAGTDIMSTINPSDIENITVIKDAAAASLYGSRAANGVIIITTKSGKEGKPVFTFKSDWGFSDLAMDYRKVMGGQERRDLLHEGLVNKEMYKNGKSREEAIAIVNTPDKDGILSIDKYAPIPAGGFVDWEDVLFRRGSHRNHELSAAGGDGKFSYFSSLGYTSQEGITYQSAFERISGRLNVKYKMTAALELGANILYSRIKQDVSSEGGTYTSPMYATRHKVTPSDAVYNEDGSYNTELLANGKRNPKAAADFNYKRQGVDRSFNTMFANYKFSKQVLFNTTFSYDHSNAKNKAWNDPRSSDGESSNGSLTSRFYQYDQMVWKNSLAYVNTFGEKHNVDLLGGYEVNRYKRDFLTGSKDNFPNVDKDEIANGSILKDIDGSVTETRMVSYLSRINYNYDSKYFIGASVRIDGSSQLHADSRWGTFWSLSGAWRMSDESFMESFKPILSETKLRASFGSNGTLPTEHYGYMDLVGFGKSYNGEPGMIETQIGDKKLKWEKNYNLNLGLDFRLFDKLGVTLEYYNRETSDLLMDIPTSQTIGFSDYLTNIGRVQNRGIEIDLSANILKTSNFSWNSSLNFGSNKNKIKNLGGQSEIKSGSYTHRVGQPYYSFYLIQFAGINPDTGAPQFYVNAEGGDPKAITEKSSEANRILYKNAEPSMTGGFTNTFKYKFVDLSFMFTFSLGGYSYDNAAQKLEHGGSEPEHNIQTYYRDRWQKPGDKTKYEVFIVDNPNNMSSVASTRRLHSTDHLRLKNLTVGFTIPKNIVKHAKLNNVRAYFSAVNLLTFAKYDGYDPEVNRNGSIYFDSPKLKTLTFGIDIQF